MVIKLGKKFKRHPELVRLEGGWRKPKSRTNKVRKKLKGKKPVPLVGYGSPKKEKNIHPSGLSEVAISNPGQLEKINKATECVRISGKVGKKKRMEIVKKSRETGIKVLNPGLRGGKK